MVTEWGFSDELGQVAYGENQQEVFLGHSVAQQKNVSEATAQKIDSEVRRLIDQAYDEAREHPDEEEEGVYRHCRGAARVRDPYRR
jgi:cell division protease FtsH